MAHWDSNSRGWILRITATPKTQNINSNSSVLAVSLVLHPPDPWNWFVAMCEGYLYANGARKWSRARSDGNLQTTPNQAMVLWSGDITVPHNADGTKDIWLEATFKTTYNHAQHGWVTIDHKIGKSMRLTKINRGIWVRVGGVWKRAIPHVKHNNKWRTAIPFVKTGGKYRMAGS